MKKRKFLALMLTVVMAATIFTGCGSSSDSAASSDGGGASASDDGGVASGEKPYEGVTLNVWGSVTEINDVTEEIMAKATDELGMTFEIEINPGGSEGDNILKAKLAANDLPDIVNWNSGSKFLSINPSSYFYDMTDEPMVEKFDDAFKGCVSVDGRVYGAPFTTTQAGAVVYWKPDYEELGLEVPDTWDEFVDNCKKLQEAGKTPLQLTTKDTWTTQVLFLGDNYNVNAADPDFPEKFEAGEAKFATTPAALESWEKYEDLLGMYNADASGATYEDCIAAMAQGEATHWIILTQVVPMMIADYPECAENIGIFGVPGDDPDNHGLTVWEPNGWYISKDSENLDAAVAFIDFWLQEEQIDTYVNEYGANGPSCIKGYTLPDSVCSAIRVDMQAYFDEGKTCPALEYQTSVKGNSCEQYTTAVATGQTTGAQAAADYDADCYKSAVQMGFDWKE